MSARTVAPAFVTLALVATLLAAGLPDARGADPCRTLTAVGASHARGAKCPLVVQVRVQRADMKNLAASETTARASCGKGSLLTGGGILQDRIDGTQPTNGLRIHGTVPASTKGKASAANGETDLTSWLAIGGFGGQSEPADQVRSFAMCSVGGGGPTSTLYVSKTIPGPVDAATTKSLTVSCPPASRLIGGGAQTNPAASPSLKPIGSFPSDARGNPSRAGAANPNSWTAVGAAGGMRWGSGHPSTTVFAICDTEPSFRTVVERSDVVDHPAGPGNTNPGSDPFVVTTARCKKGTILLGGGVLADGKAPGADRGVPQQGVHVRGSYPSDGKGTPLGDGAIGTNAWTVIVQAGGQATPGTDSHAFALCARA